MSIPYRPFSGRQFHMLAALYDNKIDGHISAEDAQKFDQRPFASMLRRGWMVYRQTGPNRGFHITKEGVEAMEAFHTAEIMRNDPTRPLTSYFDPVTYGLVVKTKKKSAVAAKAPRGPAPNNIREFTRHAGKAS